jgi:hypothetical protein
MLLFHPMGQTAQACELEVANFPAAPAGQESSSQHSATGMVIPLRVLAHCSMPDIRINTTTVPSAQGCRGSLALWLPSKKVAYCITN